MGWRFGSRPRYLADTARSAPAIVATGAIAGLSSGILGIFMRLFPEPSRVIAFLGDASYWTYLVHLPVVVLIAGSAQACRSRPSSSIRWW